MEELRLAPLETGMPSLPARPWRPKEGTRGDLPLLRVRCASLLREIMRSTGDILVYNASPFGGMEAAIVNLFSPGERVLVGVAGGQGACFSNLAATFNLAVERLSSRPDGSFDMKALEELLEEGGFSGLIFTHVDATTGAMADIQHIGRLARRYNVIFVADVSASLGGIEVAVDDWGIDVALCGSSGGLGGFPGLTILSVGPHAWQAATQSTTPKAYWDFLAYRKKDATEALSLPGEIPGGAPSTVLWQALVAGAERLLAEGLEASWRRHSLMARMVGEAAAALGLETVVRAPMAQSPTVTALRVPDGISVEVLLERLKTRYGVVFGRGYADDGGTFTVGHLGPTKPEDVLAAIGFLGRALGDLGYPSATQAAVAAARQVWEHPRDRQQ